tara:strand:- start:112 stop:291 length:180 start_codon:yes stop_codon:yes gene_type:complete
MILKIENNQKASKINVFLLYIYNTIKKSSAFWSNILQVVFLKTPILNKKSSSNPQELPA